MAYSAEPEKLIEDSLRLKIYTSRYWKRCMNRPPSLGLFFVLARDLDHIGCTFNQRDEATPFICLLLKMLTVKPDFTMVAKLIRNEDHIYARALGAFHLRLTASDADVYYYLEPLYNDYRELRHKLSDGTVVVTTMHEFVKQLVTQPRMFDTIDLPRLAERNLVDLEGINGDGDEDTKMPMQLQMRRRSALEISERNRILVALGFRPLDSCP